MTADTKRKRRGHGRPTLHDVASAAGVTRITVSRFLRTPELLSRDTAQRVQEAIEAVGYVANLQAGQLASGHSRIVAALVPNLGYSVFAETIQGLIDGLRGSGYELMLMATGYSLAREEEQLRAVMGWSPSAYIVTGRRHTPAAMKLLHGAQNSGVPVVEIWDHQKATPNAESLALIGFDHRAIGAMMARHFLQSGHRSLGYVGSAVQEDYRAQERLAGFQATARRAGATVQTLSAGEGDPFEAGRVALGRLMAQCADISAVACSNDLLASGALAQAHELGLPVPARLSVLGFGDLPISRQLRPALSTVHTPTAEIGRQAAEAVLASISHQRPPNGVLLDCQLLSRGSSGPRIE
jgi:LacI family gluconate utilization system Gnt-I transcriptional repressor